MSVFDFVQLKFQMIVTTPDIRIHKPTERYAVHEDWYEKYPLMVWSLLKIINVDIVVLASK